MLNDEPSNESAPSAPAVQRDIILGLLLTLTVLAWAALFWQRAAGADMALASPSMGLRGPPFMTIWLVMMAAMMFPGAVPMILTFHHIQVGKRERQPFLSTSVFVAGYLVVWAWAGLVAYAGARIAEALAEHTALSPITAARIGGALFIVAGFYQLTPWKDFCLSKYRRPINFIMRARRDGINDALYMGAAHGTYCLGCCWLLFVILFPLGITNIGAMAVVTLVVFAEKVLPWGRMTSRAAAVALLAYGGAVIAVPQILNHS